LDNIQLICSNSIRIKYEKKNGNSDYQGRNLFDYLAPDFEYIEVEIVEY